MLINTLNLILIVSADSRFFLKSVNVIHLWLWHRLIGIATPSDWYHALYMFVIASCLARSSPCCRILGEDLQFRTYFYYFLWYTSSATLIITRCAGISNKQLQVFKELYPGLIVYSSGLIWCKSPRRNWVTNVIKRKAPNSTVTTL